MKQLFFSMLFSMLLIGTAFSKGYKSPLIGSEAPSFTAITTNGELTFPENFGTNWKILFSHPRDFTPVCSSELLELAFAQKDFNQLGIKVAVISTDVISQHKMWKSYLEEIDYKNRGTQKIQFPIIDDSNYKISSEYGMLHEPTSTSDNVRGVFIIDPQNVIRSINFYPMNIGRNIDEIKRIIVALQTSDKSKVLTPANWIKGDDVLVQHFPYTQDQLSVDPTIENDYYKITNRMWFKKAESLTKE